MSSGEKSFLLSNLLINMKKLKLYGEKKILWIFKKKGFIAEIYIINRKMIIVSKDKKVKEALGEALNKRVQQNLIFLTKGMKKELQGDQKIHHSIIDYKKIEDPEFLSALRDASAFWETNTFNGYKISGVLSKLMEE